MKPQVSCETPSQLPSTGYVRIWQILGSTKTSPPTPPIFPVSKTAWWEGIKSGKYPKPIKLGPKTTCWRVEDIRALIKSSSMVEGGAK